MTSLADMVLLYDAPMVLVSSPEFGLDDDGGYRAPTMTICESLHKYFSKEKLDIDLAHCFTVAVDFKDSTSGRFCTNRIRTIDQDGRAVPDYEAKGMFGNAKDEIENSFWFCYWRGKVAGALSSVLLNMGDKPLPEHNEKGPKAKTRLDKTFGQYESKGVFINGGIGAPVRLCIAVSIDGGPVTQVEKEAIPDICKSVESDLRRRGYEWAEHANIMWASFKSVRELVESLAGARNLHKVTSNPRRANLTWSTTGKVRDPPCVSLFGCSVDKALMGGPDITDKSFIAAVCADDIDTVMYLITRGANKNAMNGAGALAAACACDGFGSPNCLKFLIKNGATLIKPDAYGQTAMTLAVWKGNVECVSMLCHAKAGLDNRFPDGNLTLLQLAERYVKDPDKQNLIIEMLIHAGCETLLQI
eukprot:TRINITY_DN25770_c0_g1_i1.p1 TRINITY_DN25770_c0_g1~~TRINITY_DN25770_c0_g1_i1.p1  ORF type:complete len:416 (-),score=46.96 TRINITY_DN25770_c0_g1_i1:127-1374(-)